MPPQLSRRQARWTRLVDPGGSLVRGRMAMRLKELAPGFDVVHLVEVSMGGALALLDGPTVLQVHSLTLRDRDAWRPWRHEERDALETLRAERRALRRAEWVLANSPEIAAELPARITPSHRAVAPLALDPGHYPRRATLGRPVAGLIGTARWPPTRGAVTRLLDSVWPLVRESNPEARLLLAGAGMEPAEFADSDTGQPGVEWFGRVPSATGFLNELGMLLYPLDSGGGAKVKVLEAMALGVPVVTTRDGAEGLPQHGGLFLAQDDEAMAGEAARLLGDLEARRKAGGEAHENFLSNHTPGVAALPVIELYERMIRSSRQSKVRTI